MIKTININILVSLLVSENTPFNFERSVILVIGVSHKENFSMHSLNSFPTLPDFITTYLLLSYMLASIPIHINICARALGFTILALGRWDLQYLRSGAGIYKLRDDRSAD